MTPAAAIHSFLSGFGLTAYEVNSVPKDAEMPYLTYDPVIDYWQNETALQVNLWYRTTSNAVPNAKAKEIGDALNGGKLLHCDNGAIWVKRGTPFVQSMADQNDARMAGPNDASIKRRYINLSTEFFIM
jgi:hypothetical protein